VKPHGINKSECPKCGGDHVGGNSVCADYRSSCPKCGAGVYLIGFTASCRILVRGDGWAYDEGPCDSSDEIFGCGESCGRVPGDWVFGNIDKKAALKIMSKGAKR